MSGEIINAENHSHQNFIEIVQENLQSVLEIQSELGRMFQGRMRDDDRSMFKLLLDEILSQKVIAGFLAAQSFLKSKTNRQKI